MYELTARQVRIAYNNSGSTISKGIAVEFMTGSSAIVAKPDATPTAAGTINVLAVQAMDNAYEQNFIGVALEDIDDGKEGRICVWGECDVLLSSSASAVVAGDALNVTGTSGEFNEVSGDQACVNAVATETGTASTLCKAFVNGYNAPLGYKAS